MLRAVEMGLTLQDFETLTLGMIIGFITTANNKQLTDDETQETVRMAEQADFDRF